MERICRVSILGSGWDIFICELNEDSWFEKNDADGKCVPAIRSIKLVNPKTDKRAEYESDDEMLSCMYKTLKHEIVHAFLSEAGLDYNSNRFEGAWAVNEEIVEFFAVQLEKIYEATECACAYLFEKLREPKGEKPGLYEPIPKGSYSAEWVPSVTDYEENGLCYCFPKKGVHDGPS